MIQKSPPQTDKELDVLKNTLHQAGLKVTTSRIAVLQLMINEHKPLTHNAICQHLQEHRWDKATLFRNLNDLATAGLLYRVELGGIWHFESSQPHTHFVCIQCNHIQCIPELKLKTPANSQNLPRALVVGEINLQIRGICDACNPLDHDNID